VADEKYLKGVVIPPWTGMSGDHLPIIAGKIGGLSPGEEIWGFDMELAPEIASVICHPVRIAVMADSGASRIFRIEPRLHGAG